MARESPCRNDCGTMLHFDQHFKTETGKWIPLEPDNTPHQCPNSPYNLKNAAATVASAATQQVQQRRQDQQEPQGPSRYETSYLIPKVEWDQLRADIRHLTEFYTDLMEYVRDSKKNQKMAEAEARYDRDREDGTVGSLGNEK